MKKLLLALSILSASILGLGILEKEKARAQTARLIAENEWKEAVKRLPELNQTNSLLQNEITAKKRQALNASTQPKLDPTLVQLMEGKALNYGDVNWVELREKLGIGWDSSADHVLVSKRVLNKIGLRTLDSSRHITDSASMVYSISAEERSQIDAALEQARNSALSRVTRTEPSGDIVAQYTLQVDDALVHSISNAFTAAISGALGTQRAGFFLNSGWIELRSNLSLNKVEPATMTVRRSLSDGEPKLTVEMRQGYSHSSDLVQPYTYPSSWFTLLFPRGWEELAAKEGFELPGEFKRTK